MYLQAVVSCQRQYACHAAAYHSLVSCSTDRAFSAAMVVQEHVARPTRVLFRRSGNTSVTEVMSQIAGAASAAAVRQADAHGSAAPPVQRQGQALAVQHLGERPHLPAGSNPLDAPPRWVRLSPAHLAVEPEGIGFLELSYSGHALAFVIVSCCPM